MGYHNQLSSKCWFSITGSSLYFFFSSSKCGFVFFGVIVNNTVFLISVPIYSLLVYKNVIDLCVLMLNSSRSFLFVNSMGFFSIDNSVIYKQEQCYFQQRLFKISADSSLNILEEFSSEEIHARCLEEVLVQENLSIFHHHMSPLGTVGSSFSFQSLRPRLAQTW